jgi:hypothetical protein
MCWAEPKNCIVEMKKFYEVLAAASELSKNEQDRLISELKDLQRSEVVNQLDIGTIVKINHKKINPTDQFRITKINRKNVKCQKLNSSVIYTVTPSLLEVIS